MKQRHWHHLEVRTKKGGWSRFQCLQIVSGSVEEKEVYRDQTAQRHWKSQLQPNVLNSNTRREEKRSERVRENETHRPLWEEKEVKSKSKKQRGICLLDDETASVNACSNAESLTTARSCSAWSGVLDCCCCFNLTTCCLTTSSSFNSMVTCSKSAPRSWPWSVRSPWRTSLSSWTSLILFIISDCNSFKSSESCWTRRKKKGITSRKRKASALLRSQHETDVLRWLVASGLRLLVVSLEETSIHWREKRVSITSHYRWTRFLRREKQEERFRSTDEHYWMVPGWTNFPSGARPKIRCTSDVCQRMVLGMKTCHFAYSTDINQLPSRTVLFFQSSWSRAFFSYDGIRRRGVVCQSSIVLFRQAYGGGKGMLNFSTVILSWCLPNRSNFRSIL